ncbi:MAG: copper resistance protein NlpE N-terminal domain-containing protein, partial [Chitinophagaceae bacterium]
MKKIMYILLIYSLFFWACNNGANKTESNGDSINSKLVLIDSLALRSTGLYSGFVPCADCPGIITHLLLNTDMTYRLEEVYSKKEDKVQ